MSNLIPTPIVDKNGVPSIRHKKPVESSAPVNIPAPSASSLPMKALNTGTQGSATAETESRASGNIITRWKERRRRRKATESLMGSLGLGESNVYHGYSAKNLTAVTDELLSTEEVEFAADLAKLVTRDGVPSEAAAADRRELIYTLRKSFKPSRNSIEVRALRAHKDWLSEHPGEFQKLRKTIENLIELDMVGNGGNDGIEHLDEYMAASMHPSYDSFDIIHIWRKGFLNAAVRHPDRLDTIVAYIKARKGFEEDGFEDFLSAAANHPDKMDRMLDYMKERDGFEQDGFEQYLNAATPLAGGAL